MSDERINATPTPEEIEAVRKALKDAFPFTWPGVGGEQDFDHVMDRLARIMVLALDSHREEKGLVSTEAKELARLQEVEETYDDVLSAGDDRLTLD